MNEPQALKAENETTTVDLSSHKSSLESHKKTAEETIAKNVQDIAQLTVGRRHQPTPEPYPDPKPQPYPPLHPLPPPPIHPVPPKP